MKTLQALKRNASVLAKSPEKRWKYAQYLWSKLQGKFCGVGAFATIPLGCRVVVRNFSEYLSTLNLLPSPSELRFMKDTLRNASVVFDIGANVGSWSLLMHKLAPHSRIYAFEPMPATFLALQGNIRFNDARSITAVNAAVSDSCGMVNFEVPGNVSIYARLSPTNEGVLSDGRFDGAMVMQVESVRLADFARSNEISAIDFIKLDVEGFELSVLRGLGDLFTRQRIKAIHMETIRENHERAGESFDELLQFVEDSGYSFYLLDSDGKPAERVPIHRVRHHNHVCLPKSAGY